MLAFTYLQKDARSKYLSYLFSVVVADNLILVQSRRAQAVEKAEDGRREMTYRRETHAKDFQL